jgi:uncharacterized membrane protein
MDLLETTRRSIETVSLLIELLAVAIIVSAIVYASAQALKEGLTHEPFDEVYAKYKAWLGKSLLLGLEILIAADVIRTVALEPSLMSVAVLGVLIIIRTFLSWSLILEMEGRWPWQAKRDSLGQEEP